MNSLLDGVKYLIAGFGLITRPGIKPYVIMPMAISLIFFTGIFFALIHYFNLFTDWYISFMPGWLHWLSIIVWMFLIISFFLIFIFTFVTMASIMAAPFNSLLSEKVETYLTGVTLPDQGLLSNLKDTPRIVIRQLITILYYLPRAMLCLLLFVVPIVQAFAAIIWFLFNAWFMTLTFVDYPTDNHRISFQAMRNSLSDRRWSALGFGISVLVCAAIPLLNLFLVPAAVAGATKFWLEEGEKR